MSHFISFMILCSVLILNSILGITYESSIVEEAISSVNGDTTVPLAELLISESHELRNLLALKLPKSGLNSTNDCNNKLCYYLESALSCKALGFNISKICAKYFLGFLYGCPAFPSPSELFNAPSICLPEVIALLPASAKSALKGLKSGGGSIDMSTITPSMNHTKAYLSSNFSQNCRRDCFQRYIGQANDFYNSCNDQLIKYANKTNQNSMYPLVYKLEAYQEFKNQICVENDAGANCYDTLSSINPVTRKSKPEVNILAYDCNYLQGSDWSTFQLNEMYALPQICSTLGANGCCVANQVAMIAQSQTNSSAQATYNTKSIPTAVKMFPPCLMHFLSSASCKSTDLTTFCRKGANGNLTTILGTIQMDQDGGKMPSVYKEDQVLTLQGVISLNLPGFDISRTKAPVMQVEIIDFAYFNDTVDNQGPSTQLTPINGSTYFPSGGDYTLAVSGMFRFQIVVQGFDQQESDALYSKLTVSGTCSKGSIGAYDILVYVYGAQSHATCTIEDPAPTLFVAEPLILPAKSSAMRVKASRAFLVLTMSLALLLAFQ